jgi:Ca2+/Na+ antiporter
MNKITNQRRMIRRILLFILVFVTCFSLLYSVIFLKSQVNEWFASMFIAFMAPVSLAVRTYFKERGIDDTLDEATASKSEMVVDMAKSLIRKD